MKKIVCELCEGMEFAKEGGMFVCQGCGTKYTAEEAKGMMREVEGAAPVSTGVPVGVPVGNPNQQQIDNILVLATTAYEAKNYAEAENYCNQAVVLDAMCYKAWFLKGKAVGWQSKIENLRIEEAAHSFCKAIDFAPEEEKEDTKNQATEELKRLGLALMDLRRNRFANWPDDEELKGFSEARLTLINSLRILLSHGNIVGIPDGYLSEISEIMNNAGVRGFETVRDKFDKLDRPGSKAFGDTLDLVDNCAKIILEAIDACDDDDDEDITRYNNLIIIYEYTIDMTAYSDSNSYSRNWMLTDKAKEIRRNNIKEWKDAIAKIENKAKEKEEEEKRVAAEAKKERIKAYWEAHKEEKDKLETEKKELETKQKDIKSQVSDIEKQIKDIEAENSGKVPSEEESDKLHTQIQELNKKRDGLGLFAGKEKKAIGEEIASLEGRLNALKEKTKEEKKERDAKVAEKVNPLKAKKEELSKDLPKIEKRISDIDAELNKDPEE